MSDKAVVTDMTDESTRWAAWVAQGMERDRRTHKFVSAIFVAVAVVLATSLVIALVAR